MTPFERLRALLFSIPSSLALAGALWIFSLFSLFFLLGPSSWIAGFIYVGYDTLLIFFVGISTRTSLKNSSRNSRFEQSLNLPTIALMITGRNESHMMSRCLEAVALQTNRPDEVLWVDDGSDDDSIVILNKWQKDTRIPLRILAKPNSGKASSMNAGWPTLLSEIIITLDADTILEPTAVSAIRDAFASNPMLAVSGGLLDAQSLERPSGIFGRFQRFEYMRSFVARKAWMNHRALILVSGAFAAYRKSVLQLVGGFDPRSRVEDYELTHRIYRMACAKNKRWEIGICIDAWATTDVPACLGKFLKQRERWFAGFIETHWQNRDLVGNPRLGTLGRWMLPIKSVDMIQPLLGLTAFVGLLAFVFKFFFSGSAQIIPGVVALVLVGKVFIDLCFHYYSIYIYYRWKKQEVPIRVWAASTMSTCLEPFSFQLFRHLGALMGWVAVITRRRRW